MATLDRDAMIDFLLEHVGVKAAGETAETNDATLAGYIVDSVHARLERRGLAPFATSAFPEWAQMPFVQIAAAECVAPFQLGPSAKGQIEADAARGVKEIRSYMQVDNSETSAEFEDY